MELPTAAAITKLMLDVSSQLDESVQLAQRDTDSSEFNAYRLCVGNLMGQIYCDILTPIFKQYPQLTPQQLRTPEAQPNET